VKRFVAALREYGWEIYAAIFTALVGHSLLDPLPASPAEAIAEAGPHNVAIGLFVAISIARRRVRRIRHSIRGPVARPEPKETAFAGLVTGCICLGFTLLMASTLTMEFGFDAKAKTLLAMSVPCVLTIVLAARHRRRAASAGEKPPRAPGSWRGIYFTEEVCASVGLVALVSTIWAETAPVALVAGVTAAYFLMAFAVAVALDLSARRGEDSGSGQNI
jgi:hypothetical protein